MKKTLCEKTGGLVSDHQSFKLIPSDIPHRNEERETIVLEEVVSPSIKIWKVETGGTGQIIEEICIYYGAKGARIRIYAKQS